MAQAATFAPFFAEMFGAGTLAAAAAAAATAIVINTAIAFILGKILAPSFNDSRDVQGMQDTVRNNILPRRVIYGQAITGGPLLYYESRGQENSLLHLIVALTGHPIEDVLGTFINDEYVAMYGAAESPYGSANYNYLNNSLNVDWDVTVTAYGGTNDEGYSHARLIKNTGWGFADNQYVTDATAGKVLADQARAELISDEVPTIVGHKLWDIPATVKNTRDSETGLYTGTGAKVTNCSYIYGRFAFNPEVWTGFPRLRFHVKGKALYNPAKDPTLVEYGADSAGTHSLYDPDTWEWSEDWTLCVLDYILNGSYGLNARASTNPDEIDNVLYNEIDWAQAIESYYVSSEIVSKGLSPGDRYYNTGIGPRYTINGVFEVDATPISIMESLLASGAGKLIYSQGKYGIRAGYYKAPASEQDIINEDMIVGPIVFQSHTPRSDLYNKAGGIYINAGYDLESPPNEATNKPEFVNDEFPLVDPKDSSGINPYEFEDGEPLVRDFDFPFTIRSWEAQRLAKINLERTRRGISVQFKATLDILQYSVGDTIYLDILSNSKYAAQAFYNKLGLDDQVQLQDSPKTSPYYKQFMIMEMSYNQDYTVDVLLIEEQQEIYDWNNGMASPDTGELGSDVPIVSPTWPLLSPTFFVPTPGASVAETFTGTNIRTDIFFTTDVNLSVNVEFLDRPYIKEYILQYGVVTNPTPASPFTAEDRVSTWIEAGRYSVNNRSLSIQGPISIYGLFINPGTVYDFRIRGVSDDGRRSAWTYYSDEVGSDWTPSEPGTATRYYIKPTNGTAIKNSIGTLTVEARQVTGAGDVLLSSGNTKLYVGSNEVTVANGFVSPSNGYTGIFDSGDITDSVVVELRDDTLGASYDTITLVDITDGTAGIGSTVGWTEVDGPLVWHDEGNGTYTPTASSTQINVTFSRNGVDVARWARIINKNTGQYWQIDQLADGGAGTHPLGNLNTASITPTVTINGFYGDEAIVKFDYDESPYNSFTVYREITAQVIGERFYIKPLNGTVIKNGIGTLTLEAHRISTSLGDQPITSGSYKLYVGSNEVTVANGFATPSDGYTGVFDAGDITGTVAVELRNDLQGITYEVMTLADITDGVPGGDAIVGYIEPTNGLTWSREPNGGAWTPGSPYETQLDVTFDQGGQDVARWAYVLTLNTTDGTITGATGTHSGGNLNTDRITINPTGGGTTNVSVKFDYFLSGVGSATVSETVFSVAGGGIGPPGDPGLNVVLTNPRVWVNADPIFGDLTFFNPSTEVVVREGGIEITDTTPVTYSIVESGTTTHTTANGLQVTISNSIGTKGQVTLGENPTWVGDSDSVTIRANYNSINYDFTLIVSKVYKGLPGSIIYSTNPTTTIPANSDGTGYVLPSPATQLVLNVNGTDVTDVTATTYSVLSPDTVDGLTAAISNSIGSKGEVTLSGTWTGTYAQFTFQIDHGGEQYFSTYSIAKSLAGSESTVINYTNNNHSVPVTIAGAETWTGSGGVLTVREGATLLTLFSNSQGTGYTSLGLGQYRVNIAPLSGDTLTEPTITGSGSTSCTLGNWAGNLTQVTTYRMDVYIRTLLDTQIQLTTDITLSPSFEGATGGTGATGDSSVSLSIYSDATTGAAPAIPSPGTSTYNFTNNTLTINNANWNASAPSLTASGQIVYVVNTTVTAAPTETAASITWSTPAAIYSRRVDGKVGWGLDSTFSNTSPTDSTVAWTSGTLKLVDGSTFSIPAGNTTTNIVSPYTSMADSPLQRYYIYFDADLGSPYDLIVTPTMVDTVGDNKILIAVAEARADGSDAYFQVFGGAGGIKIAANEIAANSITANEINATFYTGRTFTGGTFQTRDSAVSPFLTPRASLSETEGGFVLQDGSDTVIFSVTDTGSGTAQLSITGEILAELNTNIFSEAGIEDLRGALGIPPPVVNTGGTVARTVPLFISSGTYYDLWEAPYSSPFTVYNTGLSVNTFKFTIYDYGFALGVNQFDDPVWNVNFEYSTDGTSGWTLVPGSSFQVLGLASSYYDDPFFVSEFFLNASRTFTWTPGSPFANGDPIYYRIKATNVGGSVILPRFTLLHVSEPLEVGTVTVLDDLIDVNLTPSPNPPVTGELLRYNSGVWQNSTDGSALTALNANNISSGILSASRGGTDQTTYVVGDLLYASTTSALSRRAAVATGNALISAGVGVAPTWGKIGLTTHVSGILPAGNGGTGNGFTAFSGPATSTKTFTLPNASATILTTNTAVTATQGGTGQTTYATGDLLYASAANTLSKLAAGTNGHVLTLAAGVPTWASGGIDWTADAGASNLHPNNFGAGANFADSTVDGALMSDFAVEHQAVAAIASTTIDYLSGQSVTLTMGAVNITTLIINNWPTTGLGQLQLEIVQGATARTITWPGAITWINGTEPDLTGVNRTYLIQLSTRNGGTNVLGSYAKDASVGGESNTASNVGTDGVGVFRQKTGPNLEFRHVAPGSAKVTTTLNVQDIDIDIVEANINHDALLNFSSTEHFTQAQITTVGTITTGVWNGTALTANFVPNHDSLNGFVAAEHIDWTADAGASNLHPQNFGAGADLAGEDIEHFAVQHQLVTASTASTAIDLALGQSVTLDLNASTTISFSNVPTTGLAQVEILILQDATARTITWPTSTVWGGGAPDISTINAQYLVHLSKRPTGAQQNWVGTFAGSLT